MRVAVIGGTGALGALVVAELVARGDEVRIVSRTAPAAPPPGATHARADLATGEGLRAAVDGVEAVVNAANDASRHARDVLVAGSGRLLAAAADAGVAHHVEISIVGCDRAPMAYYDAKVAQEQAVAAGTVPWSLLRATQFHTLVATVFASAARLRVVPTGSALIQPIAPAVVARRLAEVAHAGPAGRVPDIAGPQVRTLTQLAADWRAHSDRRLLPLRVPFAGKLGRALRDGAVTEPAAAAEGPTFAEWLAVGGTGAPAGSGA